MFKVFLCCWLLFVLIFLLLVMVVYVEDLLLVCVQNVVCVFNEIMQVLDKVILQDFLCDVKVIVVILDMVKVGFIFGGCCGEGLILVKSLDGIWFNFSFIIMIGGSVGFQIGVFFIDVVLVFCMQCGVDLIVNGKFILGVDVLVVVGLVGCIVSVVIDSQMKVEIYFYLCLCGLFVGVVLDGLVLCIDYDVNVLIYGVGIMLWWIFEGGVSNVLSQVVDFCDWLEEYILC